MVFLIILPTFYSPHFATTKTAALRSSPVRNDRRLKPQSVCPSDVSDVTGVSGAIPTVWFGVGQVGALTTKPLPVGVSGTPPFRRERTISVRLFICQCELKSDCIIVVRISNA